MKKWFFDYLGEWILLLSCILRILTLGFYRPEFYLRYYTWFMFNPEFAEKEVDNYEKR
jgi:hypothetical protein